MSQEQVSTILLQILQYRRAFSSLSFLQFLPEHEQRDIRGYDAACLLPIHKLFNRFFQFVPQDKWESIQSLIGNVPQQILQVQRQYNLCQLKAVWFGSVTRRSVKKRKRKRKNTTSFFSLSSSIVSTITITLSQMNLDYSLQSQSKQLTPHQHQQQQEYNKKQRFITCNRK